MGNVQPQPRQQLKSAAILTLPAKTLRKPLIVETKVKAATSFDKKVSRPPPKPVPYTPTKGPLTATAALGHLTPTHFSHLLGPLSISEHYRSDDGVHVYVLGDLHQRLPNDPTCDTKNPSVLTISNFIVNAANSVAQETKGAAKIDVYLEEHYTSRNFPRGEAKDKPEKGYLFFDTLEYFKPCLKVDKSCFISDKARFHYVDIRFATTPPRSIMRAYSVLRNADENWRAIKKIPSFVDNAHQALFFSRFMRREHADDLTVIKQIKFFNITVKGLWSESLLQKELIGLPPQMKKVFEDHWRQKGLQYKSVAEICKAFPVMTDETTFEELEIIPLLYDQISADLNFLNALMDIYTLARLLRTPPKQPNDKAKYAIIYVGEAHARAIRGLLMNPVIGFEMINFLTNASNVRPKIPWNVEIRADTTQCLNIANFEQPFFTPPPRPFYDLF